MNFINFLIINGYTPFRKVYDKVKKTWVYIQDIDWEKNNLPFDREYFSSTASGCVDLRLIKNDNEIVWGIPCIYTSDGNEDGKAHYPTLIYPDLFGSIEETDRMFNRKGKYDFITNEIILYLIEKFFENKVKKTNNSIKALFDL